MGDVSGLLVWSLKENNNVLTVSPPLSGRRMGLSTPNSQLLITATLLQPGSAQNLPGNDDHDDDDTTEEMFKTGGTEQLRVKICTWL